MPHHTRTFTRSGLGQGNYQFIVNAMTEFRTSGNPTSEEHERIRHSPMRVLGENMVGQLQTITSPHFTVSCTTGNLDRSNHMDTAGSARSVADETGGLVTAGFKHVVAERGHAVRIGRDGDTLQRYEEEPIHMPGMFQGFGLLIALRETENGNL